MQYLFIDTGSRQREDSITAAYALQGLISIFFNFVFVFSKFCATVIHKFKCQSIDKEKLLCYPQDRSGTTYLNWIYSPERGQAATFVIQT